MPAGQYSTNPTKITVDYLLKHPRVLERRFKEDLSKYGFITEAILQGGYDVQGGAVAYNRTEGIFPDKESGRRGYEIVAEGGRYPIIGPLEPTEQTARAQKHGLRMFITDENRRRNALPLVERRLRELKNELIVYVDSLFMNVFTSDTGITSTAVSDGVWAASNAYDAGGKLKMNITRDIEAAKNRMAAKRKGIVADTLLIHDDLKLELMSHPRIFDMMEKGETSHPFFTGQLPNKLAGLDVVFSPYVPRTTAYVLMRKAVGGYGDEIPTELQGPTWDNERDLYWFKSRRSMVYFIDAPEAAERITGVLV